MQRPRPAVLVLVPMPRRAAVMTPSRLHDIAIATASATREDIRSRLLPHLPPAQLSFLARIELGTLTARVLPALRGATDEQAIDFFAELFASALEARGVDMGDP